MRKILVTFLLTCAFAIPNFAEAGNKHLLKKMTKPSAKEKMEKCKEKMAQLKECLHPCRNK